MLVVIFENWQYQEILGYLCYQQVAIAFIYEFSLSEFNVLESVVIEQYFHLCYDYETITDLLQVHHSITMSVCTLRRRLQSYNLVKRKINVDDDLNRNIIRGEMQGPGQRAGYSKMWHILRLKQHVHARRRLVSQILHELDTDASKAWKRNKPHRRIHYRIHYLTSVGILMVRY